MKILKITKFIVQDFFGDIISKDSISPKQTTEPNNFSAKIMCDNFCKKLNSFKPRNEKNIDFQPSATPAY